MSSPTPVAPSVASHHALTNAEIHPAPAAPHVGPEGGGMPFAVFLYRVLFTADCVGTIGWAVFVACSLPLRGADRAPLPVVVGGALLIGGATALGWALRRKGRPGLACLPLALANPLALVSIVLLLMVWVLVIGVPV